MEWNLKFDIQKLGYYYLYTETIVGLQQLVVKNQNT